MQTTTITDKTVIDKYRKVLNRDEFVRAPEFVTTDGRYTGTTGCPIGIQVVGPWGRGWITWAWGSCGTALFHSVDMVQVIGPAKFQGIYDSIIEMLDIACEQLKICKILFTDKVRPSHYTNLYGFGVSNPKHIIAGRAIENPNTGNKIVSFEFTPTYLLPKEDSK